jgi:DNA protecting protein DprA
MNELPFFEEKSELNANSSLIDSEEQDLYSPGNITALLATAKINNRKARLLIEYFKTIESLKNASPLELEQVAKCGKVDFSNLKYSSIQENSGVKVVTYFDDDYPIGFKDLSDAPLLLWVRGEIPKSKSVSIVGTRDADDWGKQRTFEISRMAAENGNVVVSGLALGIDTQAHLGCLEGNGKTVAILACDVRFPTPKSNIPLADRILENNGCVIAEVPPGTETEAGNLIARNRLQAAWSSTLIVTQSGVPSGTLHTVRFALELGRKLLVLEPQKGADRESYAGNYQLIGESVFDSKILGGSKEFQNLINKKKLCADLIIKSTEDFLNYIKNDK